MKQYFHTLAVLFMFATSSVHAGMADPDSSVAAKTLSTPSLSTGAMLETMLGLLLVLGCIALLAWLLKRTGRFQTSANGELKIIAGIALGPRERAVLLQVGEQQLLVGVTSQQIQTLHILEQPIVTTTAKDSTAKFADKFQQIMQQRGKS